MLSDLINILSSYCKTPHDQYALMGETLGASPLLNQISYGQSGHVFVVNMLLVLAPQAEALDELLDVIKSRANEHKAHEIENLRPALHRWLKRGALKADLVANVSPPFMAPPKPPYFVERPIEFESLIKALVEQQDAVAIAAGVKGVGGFGKTTLAIAICHDERIKATFHGGILWVTLGESPSEADLIKKASDLTTLLTKQPVLVTSKEAVKAELSQAIGERHILLVIDDLWRKADADLFLTSAKNSALLITTRLAGQLPEKIGSKQIVEVDAMLPKQAVKLLAWSIEDWSAHSSRLEAFANRLGNWAILLQLVNATLRGRVDDGENLEKALIRVEKDFNSKGLYGFDSEDPQSRNEAVRITLGVSLARLNLERQKQFSRLAIFYEGATIPFTTLAVLWGLDEDEAEDAARALYKAALLLNFELGQRTIRLHTVIHRYLVDEHRAHLHQWQADFIDDLNLHALPDEYAWRNIAYHLRHADQIDTLHSLLLDFNWLYTKLKATNINALLSDFVGLIENDESLRLVENTLSIIAHWVDSDKNQLAAQVVGRLGMHVQYQTALEKLVSSAKAFNTSSALVAQLPTLKQAGGALIRTILLEDKGYDLALTADEEHIVVADGSHVKVFKWRIGELVTNFDQHTDRVTGVSVQNDLAFSASADGTVKVWYWATGELVTNFDQHTDQVTRVNVQNDLAFSASADGTVKVWYWATGELIINFQQHTDRVNSTAIQEEVAFSGSDDKTVKVWHWATGELISTLQHNGWVNEISIQKEVALSASEDGTVKVWRWPTGELITTFQKHKGDVNSVVIKGEVALSASHDKTVHVWHWATGEVITIFEQHTSIVSGVALQGELAFSSSWDKTLQVWKWVTKEGIAAFSRHVGSVSSVEVWGELVLSASEDKTVQLWNWRKNEPVTVFQQDKDDVSSVAIHENVVFLAFVDNTLQVHNGGAAHSSDTSSAVPRKIVQVQVRNWHTNELVTIFQHHTDSVSKLVMQGELVFSASYDKTVKVWRWATGEVLTNFDQHAGVVNSIVIQGEVAFSASDDKSVQVWDWKTGKVITTFQPHTDRVISVAVQGDKAFSASADGIVLVWDWKTGKVESTLRHHTDRVMSVAVQGNLVFSASADKSVKAWNWRTGEVLATFTADAPLTCLACEPEQRILLAGDTQGHVHVLHVVGLDKELFPNRHPLQ